MAPGALNPNDSDTNDEFEAAAVTQMKCVTAAAFGRVPLVWVGFFLVHNFLQINPINMPDDFTLNPVGSVQKWKAKPP